MHLKDKTVLITGGRRIGAELALLLAQCKARIALSYFQSRRQIEAVAGDVRQLGADCETFRADLRQPEEVDALVENTVEAFGSIDCLVNMTSIYQATPFDELGPDDFDDSLAANLKAPYLTAVAVARAMRQQPEVEGLQGKIVNFADWAVDRPYRNFLPYLIAKGGVVTLTKALAVELAPTITVNAIAPGTVEPPPHLEPAEIDRIRQSTLLERIGSPADVNRLVLYLLEGTDFVTGEIFRIDGGRFLGNTT